MYQHPKLMYFCRDFFRFVIKLIFKPTGQPLSWQTCMSLTTWFVLVSVYRSRFCPDHLANTLWHGDVFTKKLPRILLPTFVWPNPAQVNISRIAWTQWPRSIWGSAFIELWPQSCQFSFQTFSTVCSNSEISTWFHNIFIPLRIPDSYDAKIAQICNLWMFWPVIHLPYHSPRLT